MLIEMSLKPTLQAASLLNNMHSNLTDWKPPQGGVVALADMVVPAVTLTLTLAMRTMAVALIAALIAALAVPLDAAKKRWRLIARVLEMPGCRSLPRPAAITIAITAVIAAVTTQQAQQYGGLVKTVQAVLALRVKWCSNTEQGTSSKLQTHTPRNRLYLLSSILGLSIAYGMWYVVCGS
jgi:hypothetical protein